ncbi:MAG TPA: response regulator [Croceibacterium sp.]|nr:response regulator [Croceibacterium sp.]
MSATPPSRPRVLVVEDEFIIALDLAETVKDIGFTVEGPFSDKPSAFRALDGGMPDAAILDVWINDGEVFPLADALAEAGVPIIFHSGHVDPAEIAARYPHALACSKPCPPTIIIGALQDAVEYRTSASA